MASSFKKQFCYSFVVLGIWVSLSFSNCKQVVLSGETGPLLFKEITFGVDHENHVAFKVNLQDGSHSVYDNRFFSSRATNFAFYQASEAAIAGIGLNSPVQVTQTFFYCKIVPDCVQVFQIKCRNGRCDGFLVDFEPEFRDSDTLYYRDASMLNPRYRAILRERRGTPSLEIAASSFQVKNHFVSDTCMASLFFESGIQNPNAEAFEFQNVLSRKYKPHVEFFPVLTLWRNEPSDRQDSFNSILLKNPTKIVSLEMCIQDGNVGELISDYEHGKRILKNAFFSCDSKNFNLRRHANVLNNDAFLLYNDFDHSNAPELNKPKGRYLLKKSEATFFILDYKDCTLEYFSNGKMEPVENSQFWREFDGIKFAKDENVFVFHGGDTPSKFPFYAYCVKKESNTNEVFKVLRNFDLLLMFPTIEFTESIIVGSNEGYDLIFKPVFHTDRYFVLKYHKDSRFAMNHFLNGQINHEINTQAVIVQQEPATEEEILTGFSKLICARMKIFVIKRVQNIDVLYLDPRFKDVGGGVYTTPEITVEKILVSRDSNDIPYGDAEGVV